MIGMLGGVITTSIICRTASNYSKFECAESISVVNELLESIPLLVFFSFSCRSDVVRVLQVARIMCGRSRRDMDFVPFSVSKCVCKIVHLLLIDGVELICIVFRYNF